MRLRWRELIIAFLMAFVLWYGVSGSERVETLVEVRVDYRGTPNDLVIVQGLANKISVRVGAPMARIRSLVDKEFPFFMDLSKLKKGENILLIRPENLPFWGGVEVLDINPSRITIIADSVERKVLPLEARIVGELPRDYIAQVTFDPVHVDVSGASSLLQNMQSITIPLELGAGLTPGTTHVRKIVPVEEGLTATPTEIDVFLHLGIKRTLVKVNRQVNVAAPDSVGNFIRPNKVSISLAVPESKAKAVAKETGIRAFVDLTSHELGSYTLPVKVSLPDGYDLVGIEPANVAVTLEQKKPSPGK